MFSSEAIKKYSPEERRKLVEFIEENGEKYNVYHLSSEQMRMWYLYRINKKIPYYNCIFKIRLKKDVDDNTLKNALKTVTDKYDILHTVYISVNGKVFQAVLPSGEYDISYQRLESSENSIITECANKIFDLENEIPIRFFRYSDELYTVIHHIANDGWSEGLFLKDLDTALSGEDIADAHMPQYTDYCSWQVEHFGSDEFCKSLEFWKNYLDGKDQLTNFPLDRPRGTFQSFNGSNSRIIIENELYADIKKFAVENNITLYNLTLAAWILTLMKFTGQSQINIGTPVANRTLPDLQKIIGCFVNTVVVSSNAADDMPVGEFILKLRDNINEVLKHQDVPFDQVVNAVGAQRAMNYMPLMQVMYSLQSKSLVASMEGLENGFESFEIKPVENFNVEYVQNDMDIVGIETDELMAMTISYNTDLFNRETIEKLLENYLLMLQSIVSDSTVSFDSFELDFSKEKTEENSAETADSTGKPKQTGMNAGEVKSSVRELWESVLGTSSFGNDINFFDVGGNSLNSLELMEMLNERFNAEFSIAELFMYNTVDQMSDYIYSLTGSVPESGAEQINDLMF